MLGAIVHMQVLDEFAPQTVLGKHTLYHTDVQRMHTGLEVFVERFFHQHFGGELTLTAGVAGVGVIDAVGHLVAGEHALVGVDDDHVVAALHEGGVRGLVLAAEKFGNFRAKTAQHLVGGIDHEPLALYALRVGSKGFVA